MKIRNKGASFVAGSILAGSVCGANAAIYLVSQDGFIDQGDGVQQGGTGTKLSVATPNTSNIAQYTRKAYFGFSVPTAVLTTTTSATFRVTASSDIVAAYNGQSSMRFYLVSNSIVDSFDETTLAANASPPGNINGDVLAPPQKTTGTIIGEIAIAATAAGQQFVVNFSTESLADLANDTNGFVSIVAEYRGQNNSGFNDSTGLGFVSKEFGTGTGATLELIPEPATALLGALGAMTLLRRRRN